MASTKRLNGFFDDLHGSNIFTMLDRFPGYWQIQTDESCKEMTTFVTRYGAYRFEVMLCGLMNAPDTFQRMMDGVLRGTPFANAYLNEVVVFSKSMEEHTEHPESIFDIIGKHKLWLKINECEFAKSEVSLFGHIVGADETGVNPERIEAIKNAPTPLDVTLLKSFFGLAGY